MVLHIFFLHIQLLCIVDNARSLPAVYSNGPVLTKLFFGLVDLPNEVDKALTHLRNALFRPIGELELAYRSRLAVLKTAIVGRLVSFLFILDWDDW